MRLRCERTPLLTQDLIRNLQAAAALVIDAAELEKRPFVSRVPVGKRVVNSVSIETMQGYRYFEILHADALSVLSDVLIISTHANPSTAPSGQLVQALRKIGIKIDPEQVFQVISKERMWSCFHVGGSDAPVRAVLTARMKGSSDLEDPQRYFDLAIQGIFSSIAGLEYLGHRFRVINLPLIYGQRIVDYQAAVESLLRNALIWLKNPTSPRRSISLSIAPGISSSWTQP